MKKNGTGNVTETSSSPASTGKNGTMEKRAALYSKTVVKQFVGAYHCAKQDELPQHDISNLGIDPIYAQVFAQRALEENRKMIKKLADDNVGVPKLLDNHYCHYYHQKRPIVMQFPCGNEAQCYCDLHPSISV